MFVKCLKRMQTVFAAIPLSRDNALAVNSKISPNLNTVT